ncbi:MAG: PQQ-binding-like beta-propeller repeat protein [Deferribacteres bacterium]|nr:PQQ-binding-like beta-propeller repeat protein [candidate division KSB1 bacterium]MCB9501526.1 PQQ-binding-like beta-propeller repeat protein [Deferribacteres bacterium]
MKNWTANLIFVSSLMAFSCSSFKVAQPSRTTDFGSPEYLDIPHFNYFHESPQVPFKLVDHYGLTAAPIKDVFVLGNAVVMVTKNGRVYGEIINGKKIRGKLKLENNSEAYATLYQDRYLILTLKLAQKTLMCYDLIKGKYRWKTNAGLQGAPPLVADSSIYVVSRFKHASRYSLETGKRIWKQKTDEFSHTTPCVASDMVVFGTDAGKVKALRRDDGQFVWETELPGPVYATPIYDGEMIYISSVDALVAALNPVTGEIIWKQKVDGGIWETPALKDKSLVVGTSSGKIYSFNTENGSIQWENVFSTPVGTSPIIASEYVFIGNDDKLLYALDLGSGDVVWKTELKGRVRTNPVIDGNYLIVGSEDKDVYVFEQEADRSQK